MKNRGRLCWCWMQRQSGVSHTFIWRALFRRICIASQSGIDLLCGCTFQGSLLRNGRGYDATLHL